MKKKTVAMKIDAEVWKKAKIFAINSDIALGELVEQLLRKELEKKR